MGRYKEYLNSLSKEELITLIHGTEEFAPMLTDAEPKYTRPQILWAMNKLHEEKDFDTIEKEAEEMFDLIIGFRWDNVYSYDYFRFDIRKPAFWVFTLYMVFGGIGLSYCVFNLFKWIFK